MKTREAPGLGYWKASVRLSLAFFVVVSVCAGAPVEPASALGCSWSIVAHPDVGKVPSDGLSGIDALSAHDIWAVGSSRGDRATLVEHFDGERWSVVPSPTPPSTYIVFLDEVTAIGPNDAWAVGSFRKLGNGPRFRTLIEHFDGRAWTIVPGPNPFPHADDFLVGVEAVTADDVWAVGSTELGSFPGKTIIEHFNGSEWSVVPGVPLAAGGDLEDVSAISPSDVVAVGSAGSFDRSRPLIERFDGSGWVREAAPKGIQGSGLAGVSTTGTNAQWAVGDQSLRSIVNPPPVRTLAMRDTGSGWSSVPSQNSDAQDDNLLFRVAALSATDAWAVGYRNARNFTPRTLIEHATGGSLTIVPSPDATPYSNFLNGVVALSSTNVWAVGSASHRRGTRSLIEHLIC